MAKNAVTSGMDSTRSRRSGKLVALAVTVLRRKIARHWRHLQKQQRLSQGDGANAGEGPDDLLEARTEQAPDPAAEAAFRDAARNLYAQLNEVEQRIIDLRLEGYSTDEMAERIGISPIALRVRMSRLRKRLEESGILADWLE